MSQSTAFLACFFGIAIGDIGLYFLGYAANLLRLERRFMAMRRVRTILTQMKHSGAMTNSILISRVIPGTRVPAYLAAGFLKYPFLKFVLLTVASVFSWVLVALLAGKSLSFLLMDHLFFGIALFILILKLVKFLVPPLINEWDRRALFNSWRKWLAFEFWPAWLFYLPIVPYYAYLSLKHRSLLTPFYANPNVLNGGLLGESKWDFLKYLDPADPSTLGAFRIEQGADFLEVRELLERQEITYPFILKPDVGQRGFGVRIIRDDFDLTEYLLLSSYPLIAQRLSSLPFEAGIFYVRHPSEQKGFLLSITDKKFPFVTGDGRSCLGDLILADRRARIIAGTYFSRLKSQLDHVPPYGERVILTECGNHCQGAVFENGERLESPVLMATLDQLAKRIPDFYFGRFDVRYLDEKSLKTGKFEIVEINGAGSEATHIWDKNTRLSEAYQTLFRQWTLLFEIGAEVSATRPGTHIRLRRFLLECIRVFYRREPLSTSS